MSRRNRDRARRPRRQITDRSHDPKTGEFRRMAQERFRRSETSAIVAASREHPGSQPDWIEHRSSLVGLVLEQGREKPLWIRNTERPTRVESRSASEFLSSPACERRCLHPEEDSGQHAKPCKERTTVRRQHMVWQGVVESDGGSEISTAQQPYHYLLYLFS